MVRAVAGPDERHLRGRRVVDGQVPAGPGVGERARRRMIGPFETHRRVLGSPHARGEPDAAVLVEHRVVDVRLAVPDRLVAPVGRGRQRRSRRYGGVGIAHRHRHLTGSVGHRIEHRHVVRARLERAVDRAVRVDGRIALVGGDLVVEIRLRIGPVPLRHDDVALDALRPARRLGQLARQDPVGPVGEHLDRAPAPHPVEPVRHRSAGLPRLDAPVPGRHHRIELAELRRHLARRLVAERVARRAPAGLHRAHPFGLAAHVGGDAIAIGTGTGELVPAGDLDQRQPVAGRVVLRRGHGVRRDDGRQIERRSGRRPDLVRVDQAVAADPHVVGRVRQVGNHVAAVVAGHDDAVEARRQVGGLRDHPHTRLRPAGTGHHAADVIGVDRHRLAHAGAAARCRRHGGAKHRRQTRSREDVSPHVARPL